MTAVIEMRFESPAPLLPMPKRAREAFAVALRARPGVWALMGQHPSSGAARQLAFEIRRTNRLGDFPAGSFEADAKTVMGEHRVYVRYVGPVSQRTPGEVTSP